MHELALFVQPQNLRRQSLDLTFQIGEALRRHIRRSIESSPFESGCESLPEPRIEDDGEQRDQNDENEDELKKHDRKLESVGGG